MDPAEIQKAPAACPVYGKLRSVWDAGTRFGFENPQYRG